MRRPMTDRMNEDSGIDDESWAMGVVEPVFLLVALAIIAALVGLF
jgi:hypothetical protein